VVASVIPSRLVTLGGILVNLTDEQPVHVAAPLYRHAANPTLEVRGRRRVLTGSSGRIHLRRVRASNRADGYAAFCSIAAHRGGRPRDT